MYDVIHDDIVYMYDVIHDDIVYMYDVIHKFKQKKNSAIFNKPLEGLLNIVISFYFKIKKVSIYIVCPIIWYSSSVNWIFVFKLKVLWNLMSKLNPD